VATTYLFPEAAPQVINPEAEVFKLEAEEVDLLPIRASSSLAHSASCLLVLLITLFPSFTLIALPTYRIFVSSAPLSPLGLSLSHHPCKRRLFTEVPKVSLIFIPFSLNLIISFLPFPSLYLPSSHSRSSSLSILTLASQLSLSIFYPLIPATEQEAEEAEENA
jgi:hypothetical protein